MSRREDTAILLSIRPSDLSEKEVEEALKFEGASHLRSLVAHAEKRGRYWEKMRSRRILVPDMNDRPAGVRGIWHDIVSHTFQLTLQEFQSV